MKRHKEFAYYFCFFSIFNFCEDAFSQQQNIPLNTIVSFGLEKQITKSNSIQHYGFLPLLQSRIDSIPINDLVPSLNVFEVKEKSLFSRKLLYEHLIQYEDNEVQFTIDPIVNFEFGKEKSDLARDQQLYKNTRGFLLRLNLGKKVSIESSFKENQVELPSYLYERVRKSRSAYGQGRVKKFNETGFDFAMASSLISYSPSQKVNIQTGHGKHFVGYGHRSLLLSDAAFNYPFIKISSNWLSGKLAYQNLFAVFQNLERLDSKALSEGLLERKQGSFHYLDYAINSKLNVGLFEGVIWPSLDSSGNLPISGSYWVPVILVNSVFHENSTTGNNLLGLNWSYRFAKSVNFYGQFAKFGFSDSKTAFQFGGKYYATFLPIRLQIEYNSNSSMVKSNLFNHYSESLTTPIGLNAKEIYGSILFKKNRILTQIGGNQIKYGTIETLFLDVRQSYIINPSYDLTFNLGVNIRSEEGFKNNLNYIYIGLSTNLQNLYLNY